eukprot:TRINITY_DN8589_c0_g2_i1.p2 TRINITY_DN8589_c0_g2~~TRINITY_DN8589_c0_g2_i1.p2  ORF type:complete len:275 (-),score=35.65 TRINITY_DN8589_c0_g2_i1:49-873(-)
MQQSQTPTSATVNEGQGDASSSTPQQKTQTSDKLKNSGESGETQQEAHGSSSSSGSKSTKITCLVNLKRHSLSVEHLQDENRLRISFKTDLLVNCIMQVFFLHTENSREGAKLYPAGKQDSSAIIRLGKGLNQQFPPTRIKPDDLKSFEVQLDKYEDEDLVIQQGKTYPLLIRLVAIKPSQRSSQNSLSQVNPSGPLPLWVQAQTTYAVFGKSDGKWTAEVIRQKLWIEGTTYELQEIYGIENAGMISSGGGGDEEMEGQECVVCLKPSSAVVS